MTTAKERAKKQIERGASVLFAHALYKRPTLANCEKLARRLGVPVVVKLPSAQQHAGKLIRAAFVSNGVKKPAVAAVRYYARQVAYVGAYVTPNDTRHCFVINEHEEDILFSSYFNHAAHADALHNEAGVQSYLKEIEELCKEQ